MEIYDSLNDLFVMTLDRLRRLGSKVRARGSRQRELTFQSLKLTDPTSIDITNRGRRFSRTYALSEWLWYLRGDRSIINISKQASLWGRIADGRDEVESNYGYHMRFGPGIGQWDWVIDELANDRDSRRATIVINQPYHKMKNVEDYPCTHYMQFFIRNGLLDLGVYMRSNDIIFGLCNDVFTFCLFQQLMVNELRRAGVDVGLGQYHHMTGSLHLYSKDDTKCRTILGVDSPLDEEEPKTFRLRDDFFWSDYLDSGLLYQTEDVNKDSLVRHSTAAMVELFE